MIETYPELIHFWESHGKPTSINEFINCVIESASTGIFEKNKKILLHGHWVLMELMSYSQQTRYSRIIAEKTASFFNDEIKTDLSFLIDVSKSCKSSDKDFREFCQELLGETLFIKDRVRKGSAKSFALDTCFDAANCACSTFVSFREEYTWCCFINFIHCIREIIWEDLFQIDPKKLIQEVFLSGIDLIKDNFELKEGLVICDL